jgi:predicted enzyme related to lactoylglutathione lyase
VSLVAADIVIDCVDHEPVVAFWSAALGRTARRLNEQYVTLPPADGEDGIPLLFQKVPEPKVVKNRVHIDFRCEDRAFEVVRLTGLGATVIAERCLGDFCWTVLQDPVGNEFCVNAG